MPESFYLYDKPIYKLSMGNLFVNKKHPLLDKLRENSWLVIDGVATNNQGELFKNGLKTGDYVYACVGSKQLWGIYRLTGEWQELPADLAALLPSESDWGYRAAELVISPVREDIWNLKNVNKHWAPSGFSTFHQVTNLAEANQLLFEPYFDTALIAGFPEEIDENTPVSTAPRNQILYGPPGTGKTYRTVAHAVALLEGVAEEALHISLQARFGDDQGQQRKELRRRYENFRREGRVALVSFHQAFTYEDFIEGIKPLPPDESGQVRYDVVDGVFKLMCHRARQATGTSVGASLSSFDDLFDALLANLGERLETQGEIELRTPTNRTIRVYEISNNMVWYRHSDSVNHHVTRKGMKEYYERYHGVAPSEVGSLDNGITNAKKTLLLLLLELRKTVQKPASPSLPQVVQSAHPPYVLIIDEINRGNVANIFGELITLIEDDKRAGQPEALTIQLPYSKQDFSVPQNLYVLGTMNTADRSVEALDTALRRRFSFTEMLPRPDLLPTDVEGINLRELLTAINARLEQLLDHDHCLGHALLIHVKTLDQLREAFRRSILPLLQEYFFGDWGKIGLVLGAAFITQVNKKAGATGYKLLSFGSYSTGELSEKPVYHLTDTQQVPAQAFQAIYAV
jgi:hypothetical protein